MNDLSPYYAPQTFYSEAVLNPRKRNKSGLVDPSNIIAQQYLEATFASNLPSFPLSDPFAQAANYKSIIYLGIQHMFRTLSGVTVNLEQKVKGQSGKPTPGAQSNAPDYEPIEHPLLDILRQPNPADTFAMFTCQMILNWYLHGRILVWGKPNKVGAPERMYVLPVSLCTPAYNIGSDLYPLGAWRIQQYYPTTGLAGIIPTGLAGSAGAVIDSREIYELKNPHPIYRWAPYSPLVGMDVPVDLLEMIDRSFWSIMSQGVRPAGFVELAGADESTIRAFQSKINATHAGPDNHGKMIVIGGGESDKPSAKWNPITNYTEATPHAEGWDRYAGFILAAIFGLDLSVVGLNRGGGFAERWAAKQDAREGTYIPLLSMFSDMLTRGPCAQWGLTDKGVRCTLTLPQETGYEPNEMSRDLAADGTGTVNEVRAIRGLKPLPEGDVPVPIYLKIIEKELGLDPVSEQEQLMEAQMEMEGNEQEEDTSPKGKKSNPAEKARPKNKKGKGSLGGKGKGAPKNKKKETKAIIDTKAREPIAPQIYSRRALEASRSVFRHINLPERSRGTYIMGPIAWQYGLEAHEHSMHGNSKPAAIAHYRAAKAHDAQARHWHGPTEGDEQNPPEKGGEREFQRDRHLNAAAQHRIAAQAHEGSTLDPHEVDWKSIDIGPAHSPREGLRAVLASRRAIRHTKRVLKEITTNSQSHQRLLAALPDIRDHIQEATGHSELGNHQKAITPHLNLQDKLWSLGQSVQNTGGSPELHQRLRDVAEMHQHAADLHHQAHQANEQLKKPPMETRAILEPTTEHLSASFSQETPLSQETLNDDNEVVSSIVERVLQSPVILNGTK